MEVFLRKHFFVFNLGVIALAAGFFARGVSHLLEAQFLPVSEQKRPLANRPPPVVLSRTKDDLEILKRNVFCSTCPPIIPKPVAEGQSQDTGPTKTSMPLRLIATVVGVGADVAWSVAVLCDTQTKECGAFGLGNPVKEGTVIAIDEKKVSFDVHGREEYVELDSGGASAGATPTSSIVPAESSGSSDDDPLAKDLDRGVKKVTDNEYRINRDLLDKVLGDTSMLARSARIVPNIVDGKPNGFKLYAIRPNSVYARIGLQNGDTIHAINGYDMSSPDKALEVYTKLKRAGHLSVSLTRRGQSQTLDYSIQ